MIFLYKALVVNFYIKQISSEKQGRTLFMMKQIQRHIFIRVMNNLML